MMKWTQSQPGSCGLCVARFALLPQTGSHPGAQSKGLLILVGLGTAQGRVLPALPVPLAASALVTPTPEALSPQVSWLSLAPSTSLSMALC